ncbi:Coenzyme A biosynthesis bifunctional protein CoaBC [bioreactor metagenome]|uniref:Coenzyme A biosynthesis bifunctional protein CoaBC n=1 Tax=bioreactor metagenome TaxID=1076179 RepID=A0A645HBQ8_9ZZZZ
MFNEVTKRADQFDCIIKAAAVADYTIKNPATQKVKKQENDLTLVLERTDDILAYLGQHKKENQILCGFAMETENLIENARNKCIKKNCDLVIANSINTEGTGFKTDTNKITIIRKDSIKEVDLMSKEECARIILEECFKGESYVTNN